jgi:Lon protease-like protein
MADLLPLFPLPNVVLFPNVFLPLHIFEPRYRDMVSDALAGDRMIGMTLLKAGRQRDRGGWPPVYPIGSSGLIAHVEHLADGRYNIVLRGVERFRILEEDSSAAYRRAIVESLPERRLEADDRSVLQSCRARLESLVAPALRASMISGRQRVGARGDAAGGIEADLRAAAMGDEDLINALAQYLDFEPLEKQALLEHNCIRSRAESLVELLEMKILITRTPSMSSSTH